jgi:hypothetical protein
LHGVVLIRLAITAVIDRVSTSDVSTSGVPTSGVPTSDVSTSGVPTSGTSIGTSTGSMLIPR